MRRKISVIALALLSTACSMAAADSKSARAHSGTRPITEFVQDVWRGPEGLPQNSVQAIIQTDDGYLWLGTQEGLVRFDGVTFTVFNRRNTKGLGSSDVRTLFEDRSGALWIGTFGGGLSRLKDGKFTSYSSSDGLSNGFVSAICQDYEGNLWVGTQRGVDRWRGGRFTAYTVRDGLAADFVSSISEDRAGNLWVGTSGGLSRLENRKFTTYDIPGSPRAGVQALHDDGNGNLWIGTDRELVRLRDGKATVFGEKDGVPLGPVTFISKGHDGSLWFGTARAGVLRLIGGEFSSYSSREGLSNDSVLSIYQDHEGSVWIGTNGGGLNRLKQAAFKTYDRVGLSNQSVMSVYQSRDGSVWIGTDGSGLDHLQNGRVTVYRTRDGLSNDTVRSIYEDPEGSLWLGTDGGGVDRFRNGKFTVYSTRNGLSNNAVRSVYGDHESNLWIGTYGGGLDRFKNGKFTRYTTREGLPSDIVWVTYEDRNNHLWVGTNGGLSEFIQGRFRNVEGADASTSSGPPNAVLSIYEDQQGALWIGTLNGGLKRFKDGKFTAYTVQDGLFDDLVYTILEDSKENLWMSSNKGIFRVSKKELEEFAAGRIAGVACASYGLADGMKNPECNGGAQPAGWKTKDGKLLFANLSGMIEVDPDHIQTNPLPPPVVIEQATINQKPFDSRERADVRPGKGELEFHYTALSFLAPQRVRFKYRLEGFDSQWIDANTRRAAYYTNIPPGSYRFRVIACNNDGVWNEAGATFELNLNPHYYQTYSFYALCALVLGLSVVCLHRLRVKHLKAREHKLLSLVDQRTKELQQDVAQRKEAEAALKLSQEYFQAFMNNSPTVASLKDEQGRYVYVNRTFESLFRTEIGDYRGKSPLDWLPEQTAKQLSEHEAQVLSTGKAAEFIETIPVPGGTPHEWLSVKFPVQDALGHSMVGTVSIDITERRCTERSLEHRTAYLNTLIENSPLAIVVGDSENKIEFCNPSFERLFQYRAEEITGLDIDELIAPDGLLAEAKEYSRRVAAGELGHGTGRRRRKDGTVVDVEIYGVPLRVGDQFVGAYDLYQDITDRKWAESELQKAKEAAESANRAKSEFLANLSHEIRTPMNGVIGMLELTLDTDLTTEQHEYLLMAKGSAESLLGVINDILDFSKIESGRLDLEEIEFNLHDLVSETLKTMALRAHQKHLELVFHLHPLVPQCAVGDPGRLRQVLINLVGNAIKFTNSGEVVVDVCCVAQDQHRSELRFSITDTGIGIPPEKHTLIFEAFAQADSSTTREYGGTGLGLAISSRLVGLMGGRIWVESMLGKGSTFQFTAMMGVSQAVPSPTPRARECDLVHVPVLVVDDNATNLRILYEMVTGWGMDCRTASSGSEALTILQEAKRAGSAYRIVLMDCQMPMMDGFTLAETIRRDPDLSGALLMMLTSSDRGGDITRCRKLGIDSYLIKPIRESELLAAVLSVMDEQGGPGAQQLVTGHNVRPAERALRVLIAEDNPVNQKFIHRVLEKMGHIPVTAGNGKEALERFRMEKFDLIFMDVQMPEMDGLSTTAAIRATEKRVGGHIPIFALTAHALKGDRERCLSGGMDGYISKPTTVTDIEKVVRGVLAKAEPEVRPRVNLEPSDGVLWDHAAALKRVGGDEALLQELITLFFQEYPTLADRLTEGLSRGDLASLREPAHTLKGSLGYLGVPAAARLAQEIEDASRSEDATRVAGLVDNFMAQVKVMQQALACPVGTRGEGNQNG